MPSWFSGADSPWLLTRLAALGMIGFVLVQSLTDSLGHKADAGAWFDRASDAVIFGPARPLDAASCGTGC